VEETKMAKIQAYNGIVVFDNEEKRFWKASEIKHLAMEFWKDLEMDSKPSDDDLAYIFRDQFGAYTNMDCNETYWDDAGKWQILEAPKNWGLGIIEKNDGALIEQKLSEVGR
jgi:hypothetical protein